MYFVTQFFLESERAISLYQLALYHMKQSKQRRSRGDTAASEDQTNSNNNTDAPEKQSSPGLTFESGGNICSEFLLTDEL